MLKLTRIDHITVNYPTGKKEEARNFYKNILGFTEIPSLVGSDAVWFQIGNIQLHLYKEEMEPKLSSRHTAFEVNDLEETKTFLQEKNIDIQYSSVIEGRERIFFRDPFGNRFELIEYHNKSINR